MKQLKRNAAMYLLIFATMLPWAGANAVDRFEKAGLVDAINSSTITIANQAYRLRSSLRMDSTDPSRQKLSDIRPGDSVFLRGLILNNVYYVDRLQYEAPDPS